jgi:phosphomannomutase
MATSGRLTPVDDLVADFPVLTIVKAKLNLPTDWRREDSGAAFERVAEAFPGAAASRLDGVRIDWPGGWLLVRASNTEPIVRIVAEAATTADAEAAIDRARVAVLG